ncbi:MAG TPA: DUF1559 domain-containing protein [Planctomycetota bacterium]|nr:DUF1559 domain-containing protein [Planctomycetota bacterium]
MRQSVRGITLVEVLVVTGTLGLLAALLVPVLTHARATARTVECTSNLRQWGIALTMYMNHNDGAIPRRGQGVQPLTQINRSADWFNCLPPYLDEPSYCTLVKQGRQPGPDDKSIFVCPEATQPPDGQYFLPYAMNMYLSPWIRPEPHNIEEIQLPTCVAFMADGPGQYCATVPSSKPYSVSARHGGMANVLFLDGHVQAFTADYLGCGKGDPQRNDVRWLTGTDGINQPPLD